MYEHSVIESKKITNEYLQELINNYFPGIIYFSQHIQSVNTVQIIVIQVLYSSTKLSLKWEVSKCGKRECPQQTKAIP